MTSFAAWTDGSGSTADRHGAIGVVVVCDDVVVCEASEHIGLGSNNIVEVRAIGRALALVHAITRDRATPLTIHSDSAFALGAVAPGSTWRLRANPALTVLALAVRAEAARWPALVLRHVRGHTGVVGNERADWLAGRARLAAESKGATS